MSVLVPLVLSAAMRVSLLFLYVSVFLSGAVGPIAARRLAASDDAVGGADAAVVSAARRIDDLLAESWRRHAITPAPDSDDAEFCRRVWLDLVGVAPPVVPLRRFLDDSAPDKRVRLIDELLRSRRFATHSADSWSRILLPDDPAPSGRPGAGETLHRWLEDQFVANVRYDRFVADFLTAAGPDDSGPTVFFTSQDLAPEKIATATSRIFLGLQLQCAQCHDHPFDRWTQKDFWRYAAFFARMKQHSGAAGGPTFVTDRREGEVRFPGSDEIVSPGYPGVAAPPEPDPAGNRRRQLTIWMASRDNPYLARAAVNRVWAQMFGRGLVDPVDAMDADNPPSHPEILDFLSDFLVRQRFDLRSVYAAVARTKAYQRSSRVTAPAVPPESFAVMQVKTLTARQSFDSLLQNVYLRSNPVSSPVVAAARAAFVARMKATEFDPREYPHGVVQVLGMINGPEIRRATDVSKSGLPSALRADFFTDRQRVETLFLATLSRRPDDEEAAWFLDQLSQAERSDRDEALGDLLWVLLNTAEAATCP